MLDRIVSPKDCALAVAVPLTEAEFHADRRPESLQKFAKYVRPVKRQGRVLTPFERYQSDVLEPLREVIREVAALGVTVYRDVKLHDIHAICGAHPQVTFFAHFEYLLMPAADVKDVALFKAQLVNEIAEKQNNPKPEERSLASRLRDDAAISCASTKEQLSAALSAHLSSGRSYYFPVEDTKEAENPLPLHPEGNATFDRLALERQFPGSFIEGRVLELRGGLCTAREFAGAVPERYDGLFDLTVCNSILFATILRDLRHDCNAVCVVRPALFDERVCIYGSIIELLAACPQPYEDATVAVHKSLMDEIRRRRDLETQNGRADT